MDTLIIISDLRIIPVASALSIQQTINYQKKCSKARLLIPYETIFYKDYGQSDSLVARKLKVFILRWIYGAKILKDSENNIFPAISNTINDFTDKGILSSLYSITNDSQANQSKYALLWEELKLLDKGARLVVKELESKNINNVYIFNGRLASTLPIAQFSLNKGLNTYFYEYGSGKSYRLTEFPPHNNSEREKKLLEFYEQGKISSTKIFHLGERFRYAKLNNKFTKIYREIDTASKKYDIVIFLSSSHEYMALDEKMCNLTLMTEIEFVKTVVYKNGLNNSYAVRCHPNQRKDPSWRKTLSSLINFCKENSIDFFSPDSDISSYLLIEQCQKVAVDISSIGIDALIMGKEVEVYGNSGYKLTYEVGTKKFNKSNNEKEQIAQFVSEIMALDQIVFEKKFSCSGWFWFILMKFLEKAASFLNHGIRQTNG